MAANFLRELPEELRPFVSSSKELMEQFKVVGEDDRVIYRIFIDPDQGETLSMERVLTTYLSVTTFLEEKMRDYIWCRDVPKLCIVIHDVDTPTTSANDGNNDQGIRCPYFEGSFRYGESIDDEWYFLYLLFLLTREIPFISVSCADTDGQFILIEAADFIPSWLSPENCTNRIWLRSGELHVIRMEEHGTLKNGSLSLLAAIVTMRTRASTYKATLDVSRAIAVRTTNAFPALIKASKHQVVVCLPAAIASLLDIHPQLISDVVNYFCAPRNDSKDKAVTNMPKVSTLLIEASSKQTKERKITSTFQNLVSVKVAFTRLLYSKLMSRPFHVPSCLRKFQEEAVELLNATGSSTIAAVKCAAELSCRILCGFELVYLVKAAVPKTYVNGGLTNLFESRLRQNVSSELQSTLSTLVAKGTFLSRSAGLTSTCLEKAALLSDVHKFSTEGFFTKKCSVDFIDTILASAEFALNIAHLNEGDSDAWLSLTPNELEVEMQLRSKGADESLHAKKDVNSSDATMLPNDKAMNNILAGVSKFFEGKSNVVGLNNSMQGSKSDYEDSDDDVSESEEDNNLGELDIDFDKLLTIVTGEDGRKDVAQESSEKTNYQEINNSEALGGIGRGHLPSIQSFIKNQHQDCQTSDSDDENSACCEIPEDEFDDDVYAKAMEEQLKGTTLEETFERDTFGDVDLEKNLLKNLLESHASQDGKHGPASQLMSQLGVQFPDRSP